MQPWNLRRLQGFQMIKTILIWIISIQNQVKKAKVCQDNQITPILTKWDLEGQLQCLAIILKSKVEKVKEDLSHKVTTRTQVILRFMITQTQNLNSGQHRL